MESKPDRAATIRKRADARIALCQILVIDSDREGNFRRIEYALETARAGRADIAVFPESSILGWENPDAHDLAAPIPGADSGRISDLARRYGVMIAIGLDEKDGDRLYDSPILVDQSGALRWKHRKINVLAELMTPPYSQGRRGAQQQRLDAGRILTSNEPDATVPIGSVGSDVSPFFPRTSILSTVPIGSVILLLGLKLLTSSRTWDRRENAQTVR